MIVERRMKPLPAKEFQELELNLLRGFAPEVYECKWCRGPYIDGYVCSCGWDTSFSPDEPEAVDRYKRWRG